MNEVALTASGMPDHVKKGAGLGNEPLHQPIYKLHV